MKSNFFRTALVLGLLSAIGPFAIDMYLPALPSIGQSLGASMGAVQASLMAFFISLGLGQLIYGPISDMVGRKAPLYFGLVLFGIGSIGCALAPDIHTLIVLRFIQGIGACAGMVVPRAVVRDLHTGHDAARLMSLLMLVFSVSPILAPLSGSFLIEWFGWRSVFWAVTVAAVLGLALMAISLPETRPPAERVDSSVGSALAAYGVLLRDRHFLGLVFIGAFGISSFFAYLANSSFILIDHYGLTPRAYSLAFAANAASFIGASQFTGKLGARFGLVPVVKIAVTGYAAIMLLLLALNLAGIERLDVMLALLFIGFGFLGLVVPTTAVLALDEHGAIAGTASALLGTLQFVTGAVVMALVGLIVDGSARPMVAGIAGSALVAFLLTRGTLGGAYQARIAKQSA
ncbi:multidrug effflux MFS transporter [Rhodoferax sp.]|uniref:multidrug effflux MFS transporter n=1 Tax=Rhodoferax sp. TaxID=50421 RepID=UPI00374DD55C